MTDRAKNILYDLSSEEEKEELALQDLLDIVEKINSIRDKILQDVSDINLDYVSSLRHELSNDIQSNIKNLEQNIGKKLSQVSLYIENIKDNHSFDIKEYNHKIESIKSDLNTSIVSILKVQEKNKNELYSSLSDAIKEFKRHKEAFDINFNSTIDEIKKDILKKFSVSATKKGGGSMPRQLAINGTVVATRYADLNFIGSGVTISALNNDTTKKTDITLSASGGFTELVATGTVNGSNKVFTFTQVPSYIVSDGAWYKKLDNNGNTQWSSSGLTITMIIPPQTSIFGIA